MSPQKMTRAERPFERRRLGVAGTRAVMHVGVDDYRVVCASCGSGGTVRWKRRDAAFDAMVRASSAPCRTCGAT